MANISMNARSSIRIEGEKVLYFDPFKILKEEHDADIVLITHEHFDHFSLEDIMKVLKKDTILILPYSMKDKVCEELEEMIEEIIFVKAEDTEANLMIGDILIQWVRAYNIGKPYHTKDSGWIGYLVTFDETSFFIMGDTDANEDNVNVKCDILFVPCGGKYTFDAKEAAEYTARINPSKAIPTHYTDEAGQSEISKIYKNELLRLNNCIEVEILL